MTAIKTGNRILFATTTSGTGAYAIGAAATGFLTPADAGIANGATFEFTVQSSLSNPTDWATYRGVLDTGANTVSRATVLDSSAGFGVDINWPSSAVKYVIGGPLAQSMPLLDTNGNLLLSAGLLLVGVTSAGSYNHVIARDTTGATLTVANTSASPTGSLPISARFTAAAPNNTTASFFAGQDNVGDKIIIWSNGNIVNVNNSYGAISDEKLKQDIVAATGQWDDVKALAALAKKFRLKSAVEGNPSAPYMLGFVAQDVEQVSPGLVEEMTDFDVDRNPTGTTTKSVKYSVAFMKAFVALGEAIERIETIEAEIEILKAA